METLFDNLSELAAEVTRRGDGADTALEALESFWRGNARANAGGFNARVTTAALGGMSSLRIAARSGNLSPLRTRALSTMEQAVLGAWATASSADPELRIAPFLLAVGARETLPKTSSLGQRWLMRAARERLMKGPLPDALDCLPATGDPAWLCDDRDSPARARLELLVWELGARAESSLALSRWLQAHPAALRSLVFANAQGDLWERTIAARALEASADWFLQDDHGFEGRIVPVALALALHPDPIVWIVGARALGRLAGNVAPVQLRLFQWINGDHDSERRRAATALAAMPPLEGSWLSGRIESLLNDARDPWVLAALGPSIPWFATQHRALWEKIVTSLRARPDVPSEVWWSFSQGIVPMHRRGSLDRLSHSVLEQARAHAIRAKPSSPIEIQRWAEVRRMTQRFAGETPEPGDPFDALCESISLAVSGSLDAASRRAAAVVPTLAGAFRAAWTSARNTPNAAPETRGESLAIVESCARSLALAPWIPIGVLAGRPRDEARREADAVRDTVWVEVARSFEAERVDFDWHRSALRVLGQLVDDGGTALRDDDAAINARKVTALLDVIHQPAWLRTPTDRDQTRFRKPIADAVWRVMDATRTAAGESHAKLFPRFAAWWAFAVREFVWLPALARLESHARGARAIIAVNRARSITTALTVDTVLRSPEESFSTAAEHLEELGCEGTALDHALHEIESAFEALGFARVERSLRAAESALYQFALAGSLMEPLIAAPRLALSRAQTDAAVDERRTELLDLAAAVGAPGQASIEDLASRFADGLGPVCAPLVKRGVSELLLLIRSVAATVSAVPPGAPPKVPPMLGRFHLLEKLGIDGMGEVWLVREAGQRRLFVLKRARAVEVTRSPDEAEALRESILREMDFLAQIYHPNVADFITGDRDPSTGAPFMVIEYLVGVDLEGYLRAGLLTLEECKPIVADVCVGLRAIHQRGLVHCDLKPANIFLRMDLKIPPEGRVQFLPAVHRDPTKHPVLTSVLIDFGLTRVFMGAGQTPPLGIGTLGFMPPEQARGGYDIAPSADVYGLAATVYAAMTGRTFFDGSKNEQAMLSAHMLEHPLADPSRTKGLSRELATLLIDATALDPAARPSLDEFASRFESLRA